MRNMLYLPLGVVVKENNIILIRVIILCESVHLWPISRPNKQPIYSGLLTVLQQTEQGGRPGTFGYIRATPSHTTHC